MEITFSRMAWYSVDLTTGNRKRELAKHLGISTKKLTKLAEEDELMRQYGDQVREWLDLNPELAEVTSEEEPTDIEVVC